jgi:hypothetical protein
MCQELNTLANMPTTADIFDYLGKLLALWFMRLFAQDQANPNYKYAWMPAIYGKQFGFVICDRPNETKSVNIGPAAIHKQNDPAESKEDKEDKDDIDLLLDKVAELRQELDVEGVDIRRVPPVTAANTPREIAAVLHDLTRKRDRMLPAAPPGGVEHSPIVPRRRGNRD